MKIKDPLELLKPIIKLFLVIFVGKFTLKYDFDFYNLVALYTVFKVEERVNRADFWVTKVINKEEMNDLL